MKGFISLLFVLATLPAFAAEEPPANTDIYKVPQLVAVQNRKYNLSQGLGLHVGYLPDDSFTKGVTLGGSYTYYFTDFTGWEVLNASYVFDMGTGLKSDLEKYFEAQPDNDRVLDFVEYFVTTGLVYTPLYTKNLLFNRTVVYGETSFVLDAGVGKFYQAGMLPIVGAGVILKFMIGSSTALRVDVREQVYKDPVLGIEGILDVRLGMDFQLGKARESK